MRSAPAPALDDADHVRGPDAGPLVIFYGDYTCPRCAATHERLRAAPVRVAFRHFAIAARHVRAVPLACAAEAAGRQGAFWAFHDALFADGGRLGDPHLWARAQALGLDLERFERDRRDDAVKERVQQQTRTGMRAGIVETPTLIVEGKIAPGIPSHELIAALTG